MIDFYTWSTPNGRKISVMLEEIGLPYTVHSIDIGKDEQFAPEFLKISPNNKIPAIYDHDTQQSIFESGAILLYLAEKSGQFLPEKPEARWSVMEWLIWQMGGLGPMLGQGHFFIKFNPELSLPAKERFHKEAQRLYGVLDRRLAQSEYVAGEYSIADMAIFPWVARFEWHGIDLKNFSHVLRWYLQVAERPGVERGFQVPKPAKIPKP